MTPDAIGVRALDDHTVEFRLVRAGPVLHERDEPARRRSRSPGTRSSAMAMRWTEIGSRW
jgi:hypothetical protein